MVHIKRSGSLRPNPHFFPGRGFYHGAVFVQKFGLDKDEEKQGGAEDGVWGFDIHNVDVGWGQAPTLQSRIHAVR